MVTMEVLQNWKRKNIGHETVC